MAATRIMKAREAELIAMLLSQEPEPGTFGAEIKHVFDAPDERSESAARQKRIDWQSDLYRRWIRMAKRCGWFATNHDGTHAKAEPSIFCDQIEWELHVCRFRDCRHWFGLLDCVDRIELCEISRKFRRER
ncbi:hypothetical protein BH11ARM1_BH11ARM1_14250 [soil metagenome]